MKNSKYINVSVSEKLPDKLGDYLTDKGKALFITTTKLWHIDKFRISPNWWLEEKPDYEDEMKEMLEECRLQLEHLNRKQRGTTNSVLSRLETLLTKLK